MCNPWQMIMNMCLWSWKVDLLHYYGDRKCYRKWMLIKWSNRKRRKRNDCWSVCVYLPQHFIIQEIRACLCHLISISPFLLVILSLTLVCNALKFDVGHFAIGLYNDYDWRCWRVYQLPSSCTFCSSVHSRTVFYLIRVRGDNYNGTATVWVG